MSTIEANTSKVENIEHSTAGSVTTDNVVRGTAKAWIAWVYSSNAPATRDSFNISSNTDSGTGDAAFNLTNAMDGRFNPACTSGNQHATTGNCLVDKDSSSIYAMRLFNNSGAATDGGGDFSLNITGDLA
jgi:hypothetical protein